MIVVTVLGVSILLVAVAQSSASPLFAVSAAAPALGVLFLAILTLYRGAPAGMVATPVLAVAEAWLRGLEPGLLLIAYAPVVPLLEVTQNMSHPLVGPGARLVVTALAAGAWGRLVAVMVVIVGGASVTSLDVVALLILPGVLLDSLLAVVVYLPFRAALGEPGRRTWLAWT